MVTAIARRPPALWLDKYFFQPQISGMKLRIAHRQIAALTRVEVAVVISIMALLAAFVLPKLENAKKKAQRITCCNHLCQINLSFRLWEGDHTNRYPMSVSTNFGGTREYVNRGETFRHFQVMSNELSTPLILVCPSDVRQPVKDFVTNFDNSTVSYFVGVDADESNPQMLLSGDRNIVGGTKLLNGIVEITTNESVGWNSELHDGCGNIGIADGSVQQTTSRGSSRNIRELLTATGLATNRLAIP